LLAVSKEIASPDIPGVARWISNQPMNDQPLFGSDLPAPSEACLAYQMSPFL
jgi:hypothetical protein